VPTEGGEVPSSLAEKAEAAFNDAKRSPANGSIKAAGQMTPMSEKIETEPLNLEKQSGARRTPSKSLAGNDIQEIEISDDLDFEQPSFVESAAGRKPGIMQMPGSNRANAAPRADAAAQGWNLAVEESVVPMQSTSPEPEKQGGGSRWYKPSTWNRGKAKPGESNVPSANNDITSISSFGGGMDAQRLGVRTPDSGDGALKFNGPKGITSPARRRPRPVEQSAPQQATAVEMDFGFMECPGAIIDAPLPTASPVINKAQTNAKHHSAEVERAAFPGEERRKAAQREEEERNQVKSFEPPPSPKPNPVGRYTLAELQAQKTDAIEKEDFVAAQRIKKEIEALHAQAPKEIPKQAPPASQDAVQSFSAPRGNQDDVVEAMLNDPVTDCSSQRPREGRRGGRQREQNSSPDMQVDEPARASPAPEEQVKEGGGRRRFRMF
jgi:hypothetical protein